jgi:hypothetical protein
LTKQFSLEDILSLVTGVSFVDGWQPFPLLCHLYGNDEGGAYLAMDMVFEKEKVAQHLYSQVPRLESIAKLAKLSFRETVAQLNAFKAEHGERFEISPLP